MANYVVSDSGLSAVADAIRVKGGTSASLAFPSGFVSAVEAIPIGNFDAEDGLVARTISGVYENSRVTTVGSCAFLNCTSLTAVSFPVCIGIGGSAFDHCVGLTEISFPACETIESRAFTACTSLRSASFPMCTTIGLGAFAGDASLTTAFFPRCVSIAAQAFAACSVLTSVYLLGSSLCTLSGSNVFVNTPIAGNSSYAGTYGSIYVPASLLSSYQTDNVWSYFSDRFVGLTDAEIEALEG